MDRFVLSLLGLLMVGICYSCSGSDSQQNTNTADLPVGTVNYTTDVFGCLISDNGEANISYSSLIGSFKSKTVVWNCADYNSPSGMQYDKHIEIAFWAYDGMCYQHAVEYITDGICDKRAVVPENPVRDIRIDDIFLTQGVEGVHYGAVVENLGNINIIDALWCWCLKDASVSSGCIDSYICYNHSYFPGASYGGGVIPIGGPFTKVVDNVTISGLSGSYWVGLSIQYKDGLVLNSKEQLITVP